jgi:hypothetical protein
MRAGRLTRTRVRTPRSKRAPHKSSKSYKALGRAMTDDNETIEVEPTHSLLLASLRFWEVERDLMDERIAAIGR